MNLTIFGANGKIGQSIVYQALKNGNNVTAYVRRKEALNIQHDNLRIIVGALTDKQKISNAVHGQDAVISALGPALSMSREINDELPIAHAHQSIITVMENSNCKRFITLGTPTIRAKEDKKQLLTVAPGYMARVLFPTGYTEMKVIENLIKQANIDWTVIRIINPNAKNNGNGYTVTFGKNKGKISSSRENIGKCMLEATTQSTWIHRMPIIYNI